MGICLCFLVFFIGFVLFAILVALLARLVLTGRRARYVPASVATAELSALMYAHGCLLSFYNVPVSPERHRYGQFLQACRPGLGIYWKLFKSILPCSTASHIRRMHPIRLPVSRYLRLHAPRWAIHDISVYSSDQYVHVCIFDAPNLFQ